MMKKKMIFIGAIFLTLSVSACSGAVTPPDSSGELSGEADKPVAETETFSDEKSIEGENGAKDAGTAQYVLGDIILADGSAVKEEDFGIVGKNNVPIAVIAGFEDDGTAFGIGVHISDTPLQWAADDTTGYTMRFADTVCMQISDSVFSGDMDGSDNWEVICAQDGAGAKEAAENYPAFHFTNTYAESFGLTGAYASGWYLPSIAELHEIYQNRRTVDAALQKIYKLDSEAAINGLGNNWYWTSSQAETQDDYAWFVHYFNGYAGECPKNFTNVHVLAVRKF